MTTPSVPLSPESMRTLIRSGVITRSMMSVQISKDYDADFREQEAKESINEKPTRKTR